MTSQRGRSREVVVGVLVAAAVEVAGARAGLLAGAYCYSLGTSLLHARYFALGTSLLHARYLLSDAAGAVRHLHCGAGAELAVADQLFKCSGRAALTLTLALAFIYSASLSDRLLQQPPPHSQSPRASKSPQHHAHF